MNTWPISMTISDGWVFAGIPDRLGDGGVLRFDQSVPALEQIAGDDWLCAILSGLLPRERAWAWWAPTKSYDRTGLPRGAAPAEVNPQTTNVVAIRRPLLQTNVLAVVPEQMSSAQDAVLRWAGADTEEFPEIILTAPDEPVWDLNPVEEYCGHRRLWSDPVQTRLLRAERVVMMFDNQVCVAAPVSVVRDVRNHLVSLASRWNLILIDGRQDYAWPTPKPG